MPDNVSPVLLDTDVFSYLWQRRPQAEPFRSVIEGSTLALSFTSVGELWYGAARRSWGGGKRAELETALRPYAVLPYTRDLSRRWGELRAALEDGGTPLGINDLWIASTSLHYGLPLVTNNRRHFERVPGITLLPA